MPNLLLLSQQTGLYDEFQEEGRASCQLHKSDSFNMLNFMSATVLTAHAIISAVNSQNNNNTSSFSGKSSPTRDTWDPMLYNINLTTYVELSLEDEVQVRKQPVLETPMTPVSLPGVEELQMFVMSQQQQQQSQLATEQARARHHFTDRDLSGSLQQKVK